MHSFAVQVGEMVFDPDRMIWVGNEQVPPHRWLHLFESIHAAHGTRLAAYCGSTQTIVVLAAITARPRSPLADRLPSQC